MVNHNTMLRLFTSGLLDYLLQINRPNFQEPMLFWICPFGFLDSTKYGLAYLSRQSVNSGLHCDPEATIFVASKMAAAIVKSTAKRKQMYTLQRD